VLDTPRIRSNKFYKGAKNRIQLFQYCEGKAGGLTNGTGFTRPAGLQRDALCKVLCKNDVTSEFEPRLAGSGAASECDPFARNRRSTERRGMGGKGHKVAWRATDAKPPRSLTTVHPRQCDDIPQSTPSGVPPGALFAIHYYITLAASFQGFCGKMLLQDSQSRLWILYPFLLSHQAAQITPQTDPLYAQPRSSFPPAPPSLCRTPRRTGGYGPEWAWARRGP
jgi:hypothetical protein